MQLNKNIYNGNSSDWNLLKILITEMQSSFAKSDADLIQVVS